MVHWVYVLILAVLPAAAFGAAWLRALAPDWRSRGIENLLPVGFILGLETAALAAAGGITYTLVHLSPVLGAVHYLLLLSCTSILAWGADRIIPQRVLRQLEKVGFVAPYVLLMLALGAVMVAGRAPAAAPGTAEVVASVARITALLDSVEREVSQESAKVDTLLAAILQDLDRKNEQLAEAQRQLDSLSAELEYYRALADLSENEANAVLEAFRAESRAQTLRNILIGFGVGLVTGVLSGVMAQGAVRALDRVRRPPRTRAA